MKKIVLIYHSIGLGGVEVEIIELIKSLGKYKKFQIFLIVADKKGLDLVDQKNIKVFFTKGSSYKLNLNYILSLSKILKEIKPDVVIGFMQDIAVNVFFAKMILASKDCRFVICEHSLLSEWQLLHRTRFFKKIAVFCAYRSADLVVYVSKRIKNDLIKNFFVKEDKLAYLPNFFKNKNKNKNKSNLGDFINLKPYFLIVGRLATEKNIGIVIKAFSKFKKKNKNHKLVIIGSGVEQKYLIDLSLRLNVFNSVIFLGEVKNMSFFYKNAEFLIHPSLTEGYGRVIWEALSEGSRCLISSFDGHERFLGLRENAVCVFRKNNINDLFSKMVCFQKEKNSNNSSRFFKKLTDKKEIIYYHQLNNLLYFLNVI